MNSGQPGMTTSSPYSWILFDADETLFHFDSFLGLKALFSGYEAHFTEHDYQDYQAINLPLWVEYQNGTITARELQHRRFARWAQRLQVSPDELNRGFLLTMAEICRPIDGARELLDSLHGKARLGVITNGFSDLQQLRLQRTGFARYFELVVISEEVGVAKPHPGIFDHALSRMENPRREAVLMVGDNPHTDILGGTRAGLDTCWFNAKKAAKPEEIAPTYTVTSLAELQGLLARA